MPESSGSTSWLRMPAPLGVFLVLDAWNVYDRRPVTEDEIDRELRRQR